MPDTPAKPLAYTTRRLFDQLRGKKESQDFYRLAITRDRVCLGDDSFATHTLGAVLSPGDSLRRFSEWILGEPYLAGIAGGEATWILEGNAPLAVFAQQWDEPRFLVSPDLPLVSFLEREGDPHVDFCVHFRYWLQVDPELVFACLQRGELPPDRWMPP